MDLEFIKEVLQSTEEYWIVARKTEYNDRMTLKRGEDQIIFISIPKGVNRGLKYDEITIKEVEKLNSAYVNQNIFISDDYPPFQDYISFGDIYRGYPVTKNIRDFVIKAIDLNSNKIHEYKDLIDID